MYSFPFGAGGCDFGWLEALAYLGSRNEVLALSKEKMHEWGSICILRKMHVSLTACFLRKKIESLAFDTFAPTACEN